MGAYYNENDPKAAAWLRELIKADLIAPGEVDERSIEDVKPSELGGFTQCHFFAGIGGWSYALRLAGWPDDKPVWTGSCPCQPFSSAGKRKGVSDERHLWPAFYWLIKQCRPSIIFGEQVARKDGINWLTGVRIDLEESGYAVGASDLCAASVQAPHKRQRLYWVADSGREQRGLSEKPRKQGVETFRGSEATKLGHPNGARAERNPGAGSCPEAEMQSSRRTNGYGSNAPKSPSAVANLVNPAGAGFKEQWREHIAGGEGDRRLVGFAMQAGVPEWNGPTVVLKCSDGSRRASAQPGSFPLAYGIPNRVVKLRGSGNAIVPQVAAEFIKAYQEIKQPRIAVQKEG